MRLPKRLYPWLDALVERGLHGNSREEVALRLIESGLQDVVRTRYLPNADEALRTLKAKR